MKYAKGIGMNENESFQKNDKKCEKMSKQVKNKHTAFASTSLFDGIVLR